METHPTTAAAAAGVVVVAVAGAHCFDACNSRPLMFQHLRSSEKPSSAYGATAVAMAMPCVWCCLASSATRLLCHNGVARLATVAVTTATDYDYARPNVTTSIMFRPITLHCIFFYAINHCFVAAIFIYLWRFFIEWLTGLLTYSSTCLPITRRTAVQLPTLVAYGCQVKVAAHRQHCRVNPL